MESTARRVIESARITDGLARHVAESPQETSTAVVTLKSLRSASLSDAKIPHGPESRTFPVVFTSQAVVVVALVVRWRLAGSESITFHL